MKAMNSDPNKRYPTADAMLADLEKFRKDPSVDMDYIRRELATPSADSEPTMPLPTAQVASAVKKRTAEVRRDDYRDEPPRRDKKSLAIIAGIFAAALVLVVLLFKLILGDFGPASSNKSYPVPDVRGKTVEEAQLMDEVKDIFYIEVVGTRVSDQYEPGQIVEQDPTAGKTRKSNLVIQVYVAEEPEKEYMKDVVGMEYRQAKLLLGDMGLGLVFKPVYETSDKYPTDVVVSTEPASGEALTKGQTVVLHISTGPETVTVPTFTGMAIANAIHDAQDLGLTVGEILYDPFNPETPGTVVQQDIEPLTEVPGGTRITFTVSGSENETSAVHTKVVEFVMPTDMEGMVKVEFEQDGAIVDSQYLSATMGTISYTFSGVAGSGSTVCAYFTSVEDDTTVVSPAQEIHF